VSLTGGQRNGVTQGWKGTSGGITTQTVVNRVLGGLRPGEIVLMHCGVEPG
jgi:hypothetical protein